MQWGQWAWGCSFQRRNQPSKRVIDAVAVVAAHKEEEEDKAEARLLGNAGRRGPREGGCRGAVHEGAWG